MRVRIRSGDMRLSLRVPTRMIGLVARWIPEKVLADLRAHTPDPYRALVTKENASMILRACQDVLQEHKGLEMVHVEAQDGTFVSLML